MRTEPAAARDSGRSINLNRVPVLPFEADEFDGKAAEPARSSPVGLPGRDFASQCRMGGAKPSRDRAPNEQKR